MINFQSIPKVVNTGVKNSLLILRQDYIHDVGKLLQLSDCTHVIVGPRTIGWQRFDPTQIHLSRADGCEAICNICQFAGGESPYLFLATAEKKAFGLYALVVNCRCEFFRSAKISRTPRALADGLSASRPRADILGRAGTRPRARRYFDFAERRSGFHAFQNGIR